MSKVVVFESPNGGIGVLIPAPRWTAEEVAEKDVPFGMRYLIVEDSVFPTDISYIEAWEVDFANPDGVGMGQQRWFIKKAESELLEISKRTPPDLPDFVSSRSIDDLVFPDGVSDIEKSVLYANYLKNIEMENERIKKDYEFNLETFNKKNQDDIKTNQDIIAKMYEEIARLEGGSS